MEWQNELDLNYYDFGMSNYDVALGRWMNMDPLAHKYDFLSHAAQSLMTLRFHDCC